jgi:hypothetical protein
MGYKVRIPAENMAKTEVQRGSYIPKTPETMATTGDTAVRGRVLAVEICSTILQAPVWLAFDPSFDPADDQAVFYLDELEPLDGKDPETLRKVHDIKLVFGPGSRVKGHERG